MLGVCVFISILPYFWLFHDYVHWKWIVLCWLCVHLHTTVMCLYVYFCVNATTVGWAIFVFRSRICECVSAGVGFGMLIRLVCTIFRCTWFECFSQLIKSNKLFDQALTNQILNPHSISKNFHFNEIYFYCFEVFN